MIVQTNRRRASRVCLGRPAPLAQATSREARLAWPCQNPARGDMPRPKRLTHTYGLLLRALRTRTASPAAPFRQHARNCETYT